MNNNDNKSEFDIIWEYYDLMIKTRKTKLKALKKIKLELSTQVLLLQHNKPLMLKINSLVLILKEIIHEIEDEKELIEKIKLLIIRLDICKTNEYNEDVKNILKLLISKNTILYNNAISYIDESNNIYDIDNLNNKIDTYVLKLNIDNNKKS